MTGVLAPFSHRVIFKRINHFHCAIISGMTWLSILRQDGDGSQYRFLGVGTVMGSQYFEGLGAINYTVLGDDFHKEWVEWNVDEQEIVLC